MTEQTTLSQANPTPVDCAPSDTSLETWSETRMKHVVLAAKITPRQKATAYLGGLAIGLLSYLAYNWISSIEFMAQPNTLIAKIPTTEIVQLHPLSFVIWQSVSVVLTCALLYLWCRMYRFRHIVEQGANIDGLTGICSHRMLQQVMDTEVSRAGRYSRDLSVVMFDLDDFKASNESFGHEEGDQLLCWLAAHISSSIRGVDTVARYGGDEFVLVLPETADKAAELVADRIRQAVEKGAGRKSALNAPACTISAGVASLTDDIKTRHALLLAADVALYRAKREGKNQIAVYEPGMNKDYRTNSARLKTLLVDQSFGAIEALSAAVDAKDSNTRGHSEAVTAYAVALARKLGLSESELENVRAAALLHDIGKIGMPDAILKKPGSLEQGEWEVVESHTVVGSDILEKIQQLKTIIPGVRHHHERVDGMGYPNGLKGAQIPLIARIIALADAFDAMVSDRSYRKAMPRKQAIEEIQRCAGTQFDPQLVKLFVGVLDEQPEMDSQDRAA